MSTNNRFRLIESQLRNCTIQSSDPSKFRDDLFNIARTTLSSKVLSQDKDYFANLAVDAVLRLQVSHERRCSYTCSGTYALVGVHRSRTYPGHQESWWEAFRFIFR